MKKLIVLMLVVNLMNCNSIRRKFHYFMDMAYTPAVDTQKFDGIGNRVGNRFPPAYTTPYKFLNHHFDKTIPGSYVIDDKYITYYIDGMTVSNIPEEHDAASRLIRSPLANDDKTLARGKERYNIYCSPCHGYMGHGDGLVKAKFDNIKAIARPKPDQPVRAENWSVERLFLVMTTGINAMNSYAPQIPEFDRWAIAQYVKKLQADSMR